MWSTFAVIILALSGTPFHLPGTAANVQDTAPVPVHEEPLHHLVLENAAARILDVRIPAGRTTLFHTHDAPIFYVAIGISTIRSQPLDGDWSAATETPAFQPGGVTSNLRYATSPLTHRVRNTGDDEFRLIGIINRAPSDRSETTRAGRRPGNPPATDPREATRTSPADPEVDNPWFRSYRFRVAPRASTFAHQHAVPVVVVQVGTGGSAVVAAGEELARHNEPGAWSFHDAGSVHELTNRGTSPVELVEIEIR